MSQSARLRLPVFVVAALTAVAAFAAVNNLNGAKSSITATFTQSGVPVEAPFRTFAGGIVYDPANVAASSAELEVATGSLDIGDEEYNEEVRKKQWFDVAAYPKATFRSTAIKTTGQGRFDATGVLTLKGKAQTITVPIAVKTVAEGVAFEGRFTLSRKAFGLGDPLWEEILEDKVGVQFRLVSSGK